jgi:hypothetical protein
MNSPKTTLTLLTLAAASSLSAADWTNFDKNDSKLLEPEERRAMKLHEISPYYAEADTDFNGKITPAEDKAYLDAAKKKAADKLASYEPEISAPGGLTYAQAVEARILKGDPAKEKDSPFWGIQVRRSMDDIKVDTSTYADDLKKAKAAELGFVHNGASGDDSWSARGVIARPFELNGSDGEGGYLTPSVQFDRVTHSVDKTGSVDSLIFGLTGTWIANPRGPTEMAEYRLGAQYATDFDFDGSIFGVSLEYEPTFTWEWLANANTENLFGLEHVYYMTRQYLHVEGGSSDKPSLLVEDEYLRAGVGVGINIYFDGALERLSFGVDYRYYFDTLGEGDDFDNFKAVAAWQLDDHGHLMLQVSYENGKLPLSHQEVDLLSVGLGVKF